MNDDSKDTPIDPFSFHAVSSSTMDYVTSRDYQSKRVNPPYRPST